MKQLSIFIMLIVFACIFKVFAGDQDAIKWGAATNDVQMSITIKDKTGPIKTNEPFCLLIKIRDTSTNATLYFHKWLAINVNPSFIVDVRSPSGKNLSPNANVVASGSGFDVSIPPKQVYEYEFNLSYLCKFDELGTYTITVAQLLGSGGKNGWWVISNPLPLTVVPGEWKSTNTPPPASMSSVSSNGPSQVHSVGSGAF
jgi:hypothetical protein